MADEKKHGLFGAVIMGLGGAIGFEIFALLNYAYFDLAGPSMVSALFFGSIINLITMLSYSELSAALPEVGGEYTYTKVAFGGIISFMAGSLRWLASIFGGALATVVFVQQLGVLFSVFAPSIQDLILVNTSILIVVIVAILVILAIRGIDEANILIVGGFLAIFIIFLFTSIGHTLTPQNIVPDFSGDSLATFFATTAFLFPMFVGMRALIAGAPEIKNPGKNVPRALLITTVLLTVVYFAVAFVAVGIVPADIPRTATDPPLLNLAASTILGPIGAILFALAGIFASLSSVGTAMSVQSGLLCGMSRDGYIPQTLQKVHKHFGTRYIAIIVSSLFVIFFGTSGAAVFLGYAASFGSLLVFALVNLSLIKLRRKMPRLDRPFKAPLYPLTPLAGIVMSILLLGFPLLLGDVNAFSALLSSLGIVAVVLVTYYLRMVKREIDFDRLRVAVGGICLGVGITLLIVAPGIAPLSVFPIIILVGLITIIAGMLNIVASAHKPD
ncbi:MAG: amino acid permease [Candidatus Bathyarchaeota archaeon]|nr:MAG: APC family permease [Candidatus Bathyarchaeum tardum]WNZ29418.1 MAG: amino acid permease [Candidatus Bathyarchaeota archaeon]